MQINIIYNLYKKKQNKYKDSEGNWPSSQCPVIAIKTLFVMTKGEEEEELKVIKWILIKLANDKLRWTAV